MVQYMPQCLKCARFHSAEAIDYICDAFPDEIPKTIWQGEHDHREPFEGDHGLLFKQRRGDK